VSGAEEKSFDVVVFGAGVAGMSAALFAALRGLSAVVVEKAKVVGGTTALSAGTAWIPGTFHADAVQPVDSAALAARYLRAVVGNRLDEKKLEIFLSNGPQAVAELHERTAVKFRARPHHPDYFSERDGAALRGRALEPLPFDGRILGERLGLVRPPLDSLTLGGMMLTADDIKNLLGAARSPRAAWQSVLVVARHAVDVLRHGRGTRLLMGNALCARLLRSLDGIGVPIWTETALSGLTVQDGRVVGATVRRGGTTVRLSARVGVVLATGGFAHSRRLQQIMLPEKLVPLTAMPEEVSGDGMECAVVQGAALGDADGNGAFWAPISVHRRRDGRSTKYPHFFLDRGKPGILAVDRDGKRFVNEATSYDSFVRAMLAAGPAAAPCFLIADGKAARAYGLGLMLPGFGRRRRLLADGYLRRADSVEALAGQLGIDPGRLRASVDRFNRQAAEGADADFRRGETAANQVLGDPAQKPNPCLGKLETPPFYAVELHPGLNGTSTGLRTDEHARVLRADGSAIAGLYACGNDMTSLMEGTYPGPGITIGPALVFASIAVADMLAHGSKT
jgi:succinate dehydrogenase/fumarate reductase flavoprotein subunit